MDAVPETVPTEVRPVEEAKPKGPATIVGDDPVEQFPSHES